MVNRCTLQAASICGNFSRSMIHPVTYLTGKKKERDEDKLVTRFAFLDHKGQSQVQAESDVEHDHEANG